MDIRPTVILAYSGTLKYYSAKERSVNKRWFDFIWGTYFSDIINKYSRSGETIFKALKLLKNTNKISSELFQFKLWGNIEIGNHYQIQEFEINDLVEIGKSKKKNESIEDLNKADVLFLALEFSKNGQRPLYIPGKIFEYIQLRKPILAIADDSDAKEILVQSGLAIICTDSATDVAEKISYLIENKDCFDELFRPNEEYISSLNAKYKTAELAAIFDEILFDDRK